MEELSQDLAELEDQAVNNGLDVNADDYINVIVRHQIVHFL
jgi:hypothetical protein